MKIVRLAAMGPSKSANWHFSALASTEFKEIIKLIREGKLKDEGIISSADSLTVPKDLSHRANAGASFLNKFFRESGMQWHAGVRGGPKTGEILIKPGSPYPTPTPGKRKAHLVA